MKKLAPFLLLLVWGLTALGQIPEAIFAPEIKSAQLYQQGNQLSFPVIRLNGADQLELHFDDLSATVRNYSYTFQLCNADWTPALLSQFDYIKGYSQMRISNYRLSSVSLTRYTHYQALLPDRNCLPSRSGNYVLKVFRDGDTSKLLFTKRMLVVEEKSTVGIQIQQPFNGQWFRTHQKLQFRLNLNQDVNVVNHLQQVKVVLLQNGRWDNAITSVRPTFFSRNQMDFDTEADAVFPGGREWRWLDLRSFRFQSDRIESANYGKSQTDIFVKPDISRLSQRFNLYGDANGAYTLQCTENLNPLWQSDYATVHFSYIPPNNRPLSQDLYLCGQLTNYAYNEETRMKFNNEKGIYENTLLLKQGYYDYNYVTLNAKNGRQFPSFDLTDGNFWESENNYMVLVYFKSFTDRADQLIGFTMVNSMGRGK